MRGRQLREVALAADVDRSLSARFAPPEKRMGLLLLTAIDGDLSRVPVRSGEFLIRRMHYQFWIDALAAADGSGHPLAIAARQSFGNSPQLLDLLAELIGAHEQGAEAAPFGDAWRELTTQRQALLFEFAHRWLADGASPLDAEFLRNSGAAYGVARELCRARGTAQLTGARAEQLEAGCRSHWSIITHDLQQISASVRTAYLPLALVPTYLDLFRKSDKTIAAPLDQHPVARAWRLWRAAMRGF